MSSILYCWAQQTEHPEIFTVTPVTFSSSTVSPLTFVEIGGLQETGLDELFFVETTGTLPLQGGLTTSPTDLPTDWVLELGLWINGPPGYHIIALPQNTAGTFYAWASEVGDLSSAVQYGPGTSIIISDNTGGVNTSIIETQTGHYTISLTDSLLTNNTLNQDVGLGFVVQPTFSGTASAHAYLTTMSPTSEPSTGEFPGYETLETANGILINPYETIITGFPTTLYPSIWIDDGTNSSHAILTPVTFSFG